MSPGIDAQACASLVPSCSDWVARRSQKKKKREKKRFSETEPPTLLFIQPDKHRHASVMSAANHLSSHGLGFTAGSQKMALMHFLLVPDLQCKVFLGVRERRSWGKSLLCLLREGKGDVSYLDLGS